MRIASQTAALLLALPLAAGAASAGEGCGSEGPISTVRHIFEAADTDGDGALTQSEYEAAGLERYGVTFEESDGNADGLTSLAEYLELYQRHHPPVDREEV